MNKGNIKKLSAFILCFVLLFSSVYTGYSVSDVNAIMSGDIANDNYDDTDVPDLENYGLIVGEDGDNKLVFPEGNGSVNLAEKYDPRSNNIMTSVKMQNPFGLC